MRQFIVKLSRWILGTLLILYTLGLLAEYRLYRNTRELYYSRQADWHLYHRNKNKVLFIGNSRTSVQVDVPASIHYFDAPMYCLSQDARRVNVFWYKFKKYIERNPAPKAIVLQADISSLLSIGLNMNTFYGKDKYLSYLFFNQLGINQYFKHEEGFKTYETFVPLVRYIPYMSYLDAHWRKKFSDPYAAPSNYGSWLFKPEPGKKLTEIDVVKESQKKLVQEGTDYIDLRYVDSFMTYCKKKNIFLVGVYPPQSWLSYQTENKEAVNRIQNMFEQRGIPYRNFNSPTYAADSLFYNHLHLNELGAKQYTHELNVWLDSLNLKKRIAHE